MSSFKASLSCLASFKIFMLENCISQKAFVSLIGNSPLKLGFHPVKETPTESAIGPEINAIAASPSSSDAGSLVKACMI